MQHTFFSRLVLATLLCVATAVFLTSSPRAEEFTHGQVLSCHDGDTLRLTDKRRVRLAGIDTPEIGRKNKPAQYYGQEAKALLQSLVEGKEIYLHSASAKGETTDLYGRLLADVRLKDGTSVNMYMVREGAAYVYVHKGNDPQYINELLKAQAEAIRDGRGMWRELKNNAIWSAKYIGNKNSRRFFPQDCVDAQKINPRNRVQLQSLEEALSAGYAPSRTCSVWPEVR